MSKALFFDYLIVGGGIAGVTAAETIRSHDRDGTIAIFSRETDPLYSRVMLPGYVRGKLAREKVFLRTLDQYAQSRIDILLGRDIIAVNFDTKEALTNEQETIAFGKLLIATGGVVLPWKVGGVENPRVLYLQTIVDADRAREVLSGASGGAQKQAMVVGGGFISLEFIETAFAYGFDTDLILKDKQMFADQLDEQAWDMIAENFRRHRITIHPETEVKNIETKKDQTLSVLTHTGTEITSAWIGVGIGLKRNVSVFQGTGIDIRSGIRVNQYLESSIPRVWAAGDIAEYYDPILEEHMMVGNWTSAFLQGRVAGINMSAQRPDERMEFRSVPAYSLANLGFHLTFLGKTRYKADAHVEPIARAWPDGTGYERLFFENGILKGAVLINRFQDKNILTKFIESKARKAIVETALLTVR